MQLFELAVSPLNCGTLQYLEMKEKLFLIIIAFGLLLSCEESKPVIPCLSCDSSSVAPTPNSTVKKVLLEEFTGVRCVNCPQAQTEIKNLQSEGVYGKNLVAVAYHAGFFSSPYSDSQFDFRTTEGEEILSFLETPIGYPSGVVNRRKFEGERSLQIIQFATWGGFVAQALEEEATVALAIENTYDDATRQLDIDVLITPLISDFPATNLTVLIIEDGVVDVQLTPDGVINDYAQSHVFRTMLTNTLGNPIATLNTENVLQNFSFTLPADWISENCSVIAFVHEVGQGREVLQVEESGIQ